MTTTTNDIAEILIDQGIYIFPGVMATPTQIKEMIEVQEKMLGVDDGSYEFGRHGKIGSVDNWQGTAIHEVFGDDMINELANVFMQKEMGGTPGFNDIHITHDYRSDQGLARNGYLHFDRLGTFKFFMYLTDCDKDSGAFSYVPNSYQKGKELRQAEWRRTGDFGQIANRLEVDYPSLGFTSDDAVPIEGPAGTMFAFHSDVFHMGGSVKEGNERRVIRYHLDVSR